MSARDQPSGAGRRRLVAVARGDAPADLLLRNVRLLNVFDGGVERTDVAVSGPWVAGIGEGYSGREELDLGGRFLAPGLIDAHVHVESSLVVPAELARGIVPRGVTTIIADPHEVANVCGLPGVRFMIESAGGTPLEVFFNLPSCVPASPLATSGARLDASELEVLRDAPQVLGLGEVMSYDAVIGGAPEVTAKLEAFTGRIIDGHAPGVVGRRLNAYAAAGPSSDHECTAVPEAREKIARGLFVFLRQASGARNLKALLPAVDRWTERRLAFCTDDRLPGDLLDEGSIDQLLRLAIAEGTEPLVALRLATLNPAEHYRLDDRGAIAPGRRADLVVWSDIEAARADLVFIGGHRVAEAGRPLFEAPTVPGHGLDDTVHLDPIALDLSIPAGGERVRVIATVADQLATVCEVAEARRESGAAVADAARDLLKVVVVERHHGSGRIGRGFVRGFGLRCGALASTVAHDHHNLIAVGVDDTSMRTAIRAVTASGGGLSVAVGERTLAHLPLPVAGLMSDRPIEEVAARLSELEQAAHGLGCPLRHPFLDLSFLGLEVIPELRVTDQGLVDVDRLETVPLFVRPDGPGAEA